MRLTEFRRPGVWFVMAAAGLGLVSGAGCADGGARASEGAAATETESETARSGESVRPPDVELQEDRSGVRIELEGPATEPVRVAPPDGSIHQRVDRDAGITARLSDGSTVWFFGDTAERRLGGGLRYFLIGSAGWSAAERPFETLGGSDPGSRLEEFVVPTEDFPDCPSEAPTGGMWPLVALTHPSDPDRVLIWMVNICLGPGRTAIDKGISVGEWIHDPDDPPVDRPITVTVLEQNLFPSGGVGEAGFVDGDHVVLYRCDAPEDPLTADELGTCQVGRVLHTRVDDADAYEMWVGDDWVRGGEPAPMELADGASPRFLPPGPFSVAPDPDGVGYVMLYTPWPAYLDQVEVRASLSPEGPWSAPRRIDLVGCDDHLDGAPLACYSANLQPGFSEPGRLGFGYYDQLVDPGPPMLGSYVVSSVPFSLVPTG